MKHRRMRHTLTFSLVLGIILIIVIVLLSAGAISYRNFADNIYQIYENDAIQLTEYASNFVDVSTLDAYLATGEKDEDYQLREQGLQVLADSMDCLVIWVAKVDVDNSKLTYVYNVVGKDSGYTAYPVGYVDGASSVLIEAYLRMVEDHQNSFYVFEENEWGAYCTTAIPLYNADGDLVAICSIDRSEASVYTLATDSLRRMLLLGFAAVILFGGAWTLVIRRYVLHPLHTIGKETVRFAETNEIREPQLNETLKINSEIADLAQAVDAMETHIVTYTEELLRVNGEKTRIASELNVAAQIQKGSLPLIDAAFPGRKEVEIKAYMEPAKEVGGDFYDCFFLDEDHLALVIADVSGKGVPAALFMMVAKLLIKETSRTIRKPSEILQRVNNELVAHNPNSMFVTAWLGILELSTGVLEAASAGHEYPIITGEQGRIELCHDKRGLVLGAMADMPYTTYTLMLRPGDVLFVYTDGVAEAMNSAKKQYGTERLLQALNNAPDRHPETLIEETLKSISRFVGDAEQFDDTTMMCIRYKGR